MHIPLWLRRITSVARKELLHILRDPMTLFFTLFIPICELFMLGYAIDTNVRHIATVVLDQAMTQESRTLLRRFETSDDFDVVAIVHSEAELSEAIIAGRARRFDPVTIAAVCFTEPEIVSAGLSPADVEGREDVMVAQFPFSAIGRALALEAGQLVLISRTASLSDVWIETAGAVVGSWIARRLCVRAG